MFTQTLRRATPYGWVAVALAFVYLLGVLIVRQAEPIRLKPNRVTSDVPDGYYGTGPRIAHFYANTGVVFRGDHAVVCYGTREVVSVRLEPPEEQIKPALNRCFSITPTATTTYTLMATAADGTRLSESFTIRVEPPPPKFTMISISGREVVRGDRWSVCYTTEHAGSVRLEPNNIALPAGNKRCGLLFPTVSTQFRLTAYGENGMKVTEKLPPVTVVSKPK